MALPRKDVREARRAKKNPALTVARTTPRQGASTVPIRPPEPAPPAAPAAPLDPTVSRDVFGGGFLNPGGREEARAGEARADEARAAAEVDPRYGLTPEQLAEYDQNEATAKRYGGEFSWLDPTFQMQAELLGTAERASADPNAIAQQSAAMDRARALSGENLNFSDPALQQALGGEWAKIQGGQGAPQFGGDADQRRVLEQALGFSSNQGPGSLTFDDGARQREQYGNLGGIIAGGGATAIEMADRARQRGDSEAWLRGQREADMANYAERGLTGSGMELLNLSADRQAAAQRNSLGDLETAKALEERRLGAINSAAGLATNMRGQTIDEQSLLNQRTTTGLGAASSVANAMRDAQYNEKTYLDKRGLDALNARTDLQNKMRDQTYQEQIGNRNAQQSALDSWRDTAGQARDQSFDESSYNTDTANDWAKYNADAINKSKSDNTAFLQQQYDKTQERQQQRWSDLLKLKTDAAGTVLDVDQADNKAGSDQGTKVGMADSMTVNEAVDAYRAGRISAEDLTRVMDATAAKNATGGQVGAAVGEGIDTIGRIASGGATGGGGSGPVAGGGSGPGGITGGIGRSFSALTAAPATTPPIQPATAQPTTPQAGTTTRPARHRTTAATAGAAYDPEKIRKAMGYT